MKQLELKKKHTNILQEVTGLKKLTQFEKHKKKTKSKQEHNIKHLFLMLKLLYTDWYNNINDKIKAID